LKITNIIHSFFFSAVKLKQNEGFLFSGAFLAFFFLMCAYYIIRPIRDEMGIQGGVDSLQWLFSLTFGGMLLVVPAFGWATRRFSGRRLIPIIYTFLIINILTFFFFFYVMKETVILARIFFVWVSVFNLFIISLFWSYMNDLFSPEQTHRLFAPIAAGGSAGAVAGPGVALALNRWFDPIFLLPVSAFLLLVSVFFIFILPGYSPQNKIISKTKDLENKETIQGSIYSGMLRVFRSPYLSGISLYLIFHSALSTFLYFEQAHIIKEYIHSPSERTSLFALMDLSVNIITILSQLFISSRINIRYGIAVSLAIIPAASAAGFFILGLYTVPVTLVVFQIIRRSGNYAVARPAREILFSVLPKEDRYRSKNFIDTVIYRGGDAGSGWIFSALKGFMNPGSIAFAAVPIALLWAVTGFLLGKSYYLKDRKEKCSSQNESLSFEFAREKS